MLKGAKATNRGQRGPLIFRNAPNGRVPPIQSKNCLETTFKNLQRSFAGFII